MPLFRLSDNPHPSPLMKLLAIRLSWHKTPAKSLVIPPAGEGMMSCL
jgi:hypothetical protein